MEMNDFQKNYKITFVIESPKRILMDDEICTQLERYTNHK